MTTTAPAKTAETVTEWGIRWPAGEYEPCYCERDARILAEDFAGVWVVSRVVTCTSWEVTA